MVHLLFAFEASYDSFKETGVRFGKFIHEIGAHHVYPGFLSWA